MTEQKQPLTTFRVGGVKASVWLNLGKEDKRYLSVTIVRSYFNEETKEWHDTSSYSRDDLPKVRLAADQAYEYIFAKTQEMNREEPAPGFAEKELQRRGQTPAMAEAARGGK